MREHLKRKKNLEEKLKKLKELEESGKMDDEQEADEDQLRCHILR
jgi:hypothetical protein